MARIRPIVTLLLVVTLIWVRLTGFELHLCFDGTEPPISVQSSAADLNDALADLARAQVHPPAGWDVDVDLSGKPLSPTAQHHVDLPVLAAVFVCVLLLLSHSAEPAPPIAERRFPPPRPHSRPLLRAPPY